LRDAQGVTWALTDSVDLETNPIIQRYPAGGSRSSRGDTTTANMATLAESVAAATLLVLSPCARALLAERRRSARPMRGNQLHAPSRWSRYAVHPSDIAPALLALDAAVLLRGEMGSTRCR
jgi:CO/xanthine dehydrogenase FAD-binding subunit